MMLVEMVVLEVNNTWEHVPLPFNKSIVGCQWVYTFQIEGTIDHYACILKILDMIKVRFFSNSKNHVSYFSRYGFYLSLASSLIRHKKCLPSS